MASNLKKWIDENYPRFGGWLDAIGAFAAAAREKFDNAIPVMMNQITKLGTTIVDETPKIIDALNRLSNAIFGGGEGGGGLGSFMTNFSNIVTSAVSTMVSQIRILIEMLAIMVEATKAAFSGDFNTYVNKSLEFGAKFGEFWNTVQNQWGNFTNPQGFATGGTAVTAGRYIVGENGAEMVDLPGGAKVYDHGQSMSRLGGGGNSYNITINIDGRTTIDRSMIDQLTAELQKQLNRKGNRLAWAG
jgi:hypothetical protein